ncbi:hypothetical protein KCP71_09925 [Salmonella enterica subsp. enterica]|nr:hypothetical protein KCP71_09925 [Salmonella enterica subsp. enterica]
MFKVLSRGVNIESVVIRYSGESVNVAPVIWVCTAATGLSFYGVAETANSRPELFLVKL